MEWANVATNRSEFDVHGQHEALFLARFSTIHAAGRSRVVQIRRLQQINGGHAEQPTLGLPDPASCSSMLPAGDLRRYLKLPVTFCDARILIFHDVQNGHHGL